MNYDSILIVAKSKGFTLPALAKAIGMSKTSLYKSMSGTSKSMKIETLEKIANVLDVPISFFFDIIPKQTYGEDIVREQEVNWKYQTDESNTQLAKKSLAIEMLENKVDKLFQENIKNQYIIDSLIRKTKENEDVFHEIIEKIKIGLNEKGSE
jgi:transcriptional regulator with XRE-family HTH domain